MSTFREVLEAQSSIPERHVILKPNSFADDWQSRPKEDVALGLRRVSDADIQTARAEAAKFAIDMHDDEEGRYEAFSDALMRWLIIRGTCDANDIRVNHPLFDGSEENVRNALTKEAIRYTWDHVDRFHAETGPLIPEASDEDFLTLASYLQTPELLEVMSTANRKRFRKFVTFMLEDIRESQPVPLTTEASENEE